MTMSMTLDVVAPREPLGDPKPPDPAPTPENVARRAYELYEARGREAGADIDDWLRAERELGRFPPQDVSTMV